jgi:hypothetical protein
MPVYVYNVNCAVQCSAVQCSAVQCSAVQCSAVQRDRAGVGIVGRWPGADYSIGPRPCTTLHCTALHCTVLHCTALGGG